ncbi:MAG: hypothetical protein VKL39_14080 [Leptolyngbyaceae bacterium]|nr:hypothetical protein [Leptolyngbyaceae bacterium]
MTSYNYVVAVTPHNSTNIAGPKRLCDALYVGGTGAVNLVQYDDTAAVVPAVPAGSILPIRCLRVNETSTTATNIVALYL